MINTKVRIFNIFRSVFKINVMGELLARSIRSNNFLSNFLSKLAPNNYQYPKNTYRKTKINGISLNLDISDYIGHYIYFGFKDAGFKELINLSKNKHIIFDIGANIGFTALNMANATTGNKVYAFEPDPFNYQRLEGNLNLNKEIIVYPNKIGLGDAENKLKLAVITEDNLGGNRIDSTAETNFNWVVISTIDVFSKNNSVPKVDLIKIDVEGFEYNVLKGGVNCIINDRPTFFIELDDENLKLQNSSAKELVSFLENYYSKIYDAESKSKITSNDDFTNCHMDIVACN